MRDCEATISFKSTRYGEEDCIDCAKDMPTGWCAKQWVYRDPNASDVGVKGECLLDSQAKETDASASLYVL